LPVNKSVNKRVNLFLGAFLLVFVALAGRLFFIQRYDRPRLLNCIEREQTVRVDVPARRGRILDSAMRPLALPVPTASIAIDPSLVVDRSATAAALAGVLDIHRQEFFERLVVYRRRRFAWVKRQVSAEAAEAVEGLNLPGVIIVDEAGRHYPNGGLLAHVLGFVGVDGKGLAGIEAKYDDVLSGEKGYRVYERDGTSTLRITDKSIYVPPIDGKDVVLTVDARIQGFVEEELDAICQRYNPVSVSAVVMEPHTGYILAMANRPGYDPNNYRRTPVDARRNRAIADAFEPGSVLKPFIAAGVLDERLAGINDRFNCENGIYRVSRGRVLHDAHPYGWLSLRNVVVRSSNIGMSKVGKLLGADRMRRYLKALGFGRKTGIPLPGEASGVLRDLRKWTDYTVTSVSFGHEISVTALQLTRAFCTLANGGVALKPKLVKLIVADDVEDRSAPDVIARVYTKDTADEMVEDVMAAVVREGTGRRAAIEEYQLAGKTGTAQKVMGGVFSHSKFVGSFVCVAPARKPRLVIVIMVNEPRAGGAYYGGIVAAPFASRIAKNALEYLGVKPLETFRLASRRWSD